LSLLIKNDACHESVLVKQHFKRWFRPYRRHLSATKILSHYT